MASKSRFFKGESLIEKPLMDEFFKPPCIVFSPQEELSSEPSLGDESVSSFLDEKDSSASLEDLFGHSVSQGLRKNTIIAVGLGRKKKLLKIFLISGGAIALLLLALRTGNYLLANSSSVRQDPAALSKISLPPDKPIIPSSNLSGNFQESGLLIPSPPPPRPVPEEKKSIRPRSPAKGIKALPKLKKKPQAAINKKVGKPAYPAEAGRDAERIYKLYINRKFILGETSAISLKLSLLGIENRIVKRKDGGYTIFAGAFKELSDAREARNKVLDAGYQAGIYFVVKK